VRGTKEIKEGIKEISWYSEFIGWEIEEGSLETFFKEKVPGSFSIEHNKEFGVYFLMPVKEKELSFKELKEKSEMYKILKDTDNSYSKSLFEHD